MLYPCTLKIFSSGGDTNKYIKIAIKTPFKLYTRHVEMVPMKAKGPLGKVSNWINFTSKEF